MSLLPDKETTTTPLKHIEEAATKLQLTASETSLCLQVASNIISSEEMTGKRPTLIAGVAIWIIVQNSNTLKQRKDFQNPLTIQRVLGLNANHNHI